MIPVRDPVKNNYSTIVVLDNAYKPSAINSQLNVKDEEFVCPIHGSKNSKPKGSKRGRTTSKSRKILCNLFGKSSLEKKLDNFGIKTRHSMSKWCFGRPRNDDEDTHLITFRELAGIDIKVIYEIYDAMKDRIEELERKLKFETDNMEVLSNEKEKQRRVAKELEEAARRMLRPWVNFLPKSEDMTRALMLN